MTYLSPLSWSSPLLLATLKTRIPQWAGGKVRWREHEVRSWRPSYIPASRGSFDYCKRKRKAFGEEREYLILETAHGDLTLSVPADMADSVGMRPPIDEDDVEDLFDLLAKKDIREPANWSRRFKNHQEKLKSGDIYQVAEVVRNLALRESAKGLSAGEKSMLDKSRQILISELSISMDVTEDEALEEVETRLAG